MPNPAQTELARRELARRYYSHYLAYSHGDSWKETKMSRYVAESIQAFLEEDTGHAYDILIIETPPQHGKSMTVTETLPSWYLGLHPDSNVIIASYDTDFAERFCRKNKEKIKRCGRTLFGTGIGAVDRAGEFELANGRGRMISRGIMAGITGNAANLIIIDDPVKNQLEADSPTYRNKLWAEWQASIKSRLAAKGKVVVIMTPWTDDDLASRILKSEPSAKLLRLPVEAEENDPLGRAPGEALCPELGKDNLWLKDFKSSYISDPQGGQRAWTALYQCSPRAEEGNLILRQWWKYYNPDGIKRFASQLISVDASFKDSDTSDYVSVQVWGKLGTDYYLLYCLNKRLNFPATVDAIRAVQRLYPQAQAVLIEEAANGAAIISTLQREMHVIPVNPLGGKVARVNAVSPAIESGHVFLPAPETAPWVAAFIDQFTIFPNGKHDDMVDAASQALSRMIYSSGTLTESAAKPRGFFDLARLFDPYGIRKEKL